MDPALALTISTIVSLASALISIATASIAVWTVRKNLAEARVQRVEQRAAEGYLQILRLVEQLGQWIDAELYNFGLDRDARMYNAVELMQVPEPPLADRATILAILAAYGSTSVNECHNMWRSAADSTTYLIKSVHVGFRLGQDPYPTIRTEQMVELTQELQPREHAARKALGEAVAKELRHR